MGTCSKRSRGLIVGLVAALSFTGCAATVGGAPSEAPRTSVRISYDRDGTGDAHTRTATLSCPSHEHAAACRRLEELEAAIFRPVSPRMACTMIFGGPQIARIRGVVRGRHVDARFNKRNGCEIARWRKVEPVLEVAARG